MQEWRSVPVFGVRSESNSYVIRPSAYGIIEDACGKLALVRTPQGIFLPGGGIESGETPEQTVMRESIEE